LLSEAKKNDKNDVKGASNSNKFQSSSSTR
jgi:hypothetical protein